MDGPSVSVDPKVGAVGSVRLGATRDGRGTSFLGADARLTSAWTEKMPTTFEDALPVA
jgi:hypothetical protein